MTSVTLDQFRMMVDINIKHMVPEDMMDKVQKYELVTNVVDGLKGDPEVHHITITHKEHTLRMPIIIGDSDPDHIMFSAGQAACFVIETGMLLGHKVGEIIFAIAAGLNLHPQGFSKDGDGPYMIISSFIPFLVLKVYGGSNMLGVESKFGIFKLDTKFKLDVNTDVANMVKTIKDAISKLDKI